MSTGPRLGAPFVVWLARNQCALRGHREMRFLISITFLAASFMSIATASDAVDRQDAWVTSFPLECLAEIAESIPPACRQIILVITRDWNGSHAVATRFARANAAAPWLQSGSATAALIGKRGLAWAAGIMDVSNRAGPRKVEGDLRSPAGIFRLGAVFSQTNFDKTQMPMIQITPHTEAIDDPHSRYYNRIVDRDKIAEPDWRSSEQMARVKDYALGVTVDANSARKPGAGSCIFLHLWMGDRKGTSGCTVLRSPDLTELAQWLDPAKHPVLVQMPAEE